MLKLLEHHVKALISRKSNFKCLGNIFENVDQKSAALLKKGKIAKSCIQFNSEELWAIIWGCLYMKILVAFIVWRRCKAASWRQVSMNQGTIVQIWKKAKHCFVYNLTYWFIATSSKYKDKQTKTIQFVQVKYNNVFKVCEWRKCYCIYQVRFLKTISTQLYPNMAI